LLDILTGNKTKILKE